MDSNNWRAAQAQVQAQGQLPVQGNESGNGTGAAMDTGDWRSQLQPDSRQRIVIKIMETLKRHLPFSGQEGLQELKNIAERFEEKIYTGATSQSDYLRKISLKMLTMETKSQSSMTNTIQTSNANSSKNPSDSASSGMQAQVPNQGQPLPVQPQQQLLQQNIQNNMTATAVPNTAGLSSALPTVGGLTQATMANVNQNSNMQNISNVAHNQLSNTMGPGMSSNIYANPQRQMQGRQQQVAPQQQQQSQNPQHYLYPQQLQHQLMKQKQGNMPQSLVQSHIQQQQQQHQNILQSSQHAMMQPSVIQSPPLSNLQKNQQTSSQQSNQTIVQQPVRQQQQQPPQQASMIHQPQTSMSQQPMLGTQQQQQMMNQQPNAANMQQNQLISQPNNLSDMQQQQPQQHRMISQQNNISNLQQQQQQLIGQNNLPTMHQQQLGPQSSVSGLQQQQVIGTQTSNSGIPNNQQSVQMLQQAKVPAQQQMQPTATGLLSNQGQQSQPQVQLAQPQLISQIQSQPAQLQQQIGGLQQQQANTLQRDMQQRLRALNPSLHHQNGVDQRKQLYQSQRPMPEASSTSLDSTAQTGSAHGGDWQEEAYQKIRSMKEMYYVELNDLYQKIAAKLQQHDSLPQQPTNDNLGRLRNFQIGMERFLHFLRLNKNEIQLAHRDKIGLFEKQIVNILNPNTRKAVPLQQGQLPRPNMHAMQQSQQPQSQISQMQPHENQMNSQMQSMNAQGPVTSMQQNNLANLQPNSLSSASNISNPQQNLMNNIQPGSNLDPAQGNAQNSLQQVALSSLQQNPVSVAQQMNINPIASQSGMNTLQSNLNPLQPNSNMIQHQHLKQQDHQMLQNQQLKQQIQQRHMQQQLLQRQQLGQQQPGQLPAHQMPQIHQITDAGDLKMRQQMGIKSGILQQHHPAGQRATYHHQQLKPGNPFPNSSPQVHQAVSPQIPQHPSPQIDQQSSLTSLSKVGTPLQPLNSPFIVPSPSTPMAPSPMPVETEKVNPGVSSHSNAGITGHQQQNVASAPAQSLAIATPGISASPLLAEFTSPDGAYGLSSTIVAGKSITAEQPHERLMKAVKSISPKALSASVSDISSVVSMIDRIAGSAPGNGSRAAVGEDLVAMTKCRLQARNFFTQDGPPGTKKMRRHTSATPSNVVSSAGSVNDSFRQLNASEVSDLESTATSCIKRPRVEANHALVEEIREINRRLIDTVVEISDEDIDPTVLAGAAEGEGTIVKCSFSAVALCPNLKSQYASAQVSPIQPLRLLIPNNYPNCCPIFLDKFPVEVSKEYEDLSIKAKSRFSISLRSLSQPMSLSEIARTWDVCARAVISEYAQQSGGGSFSSKYGTWENCLSAA